MKIDLLSIWSNCSGFDYNEGSNFSLQVLKKVECSYMRVFTVLGAIGLVLIIMKEAISACRFLKKWNVLVCGFLL